MIVSQNYTPSPIPFVNYLYHWKYWTINLHNKSCFHVEMELILCTDIEPIWGPQTFKTGLEYDSISEIDFYGFNISGVIDRRWELCEKLLTREELW